MTYRAQHRRIARVYARLAALQAQGKAPPPGYVSSKYLARLSHQIGQPVSASSFDRELARILIKLRLRF